jgi:hypothetical protein
VDSDWLDLDHLQNMNGSLVCSLTILA